MIRDSLASLLSVGALAVTGLAVAAGVQAAGVVVQPLSGVPVTAALRELSSERVVFETNAGLQTLETVDLLSITVGPGARSDTAAEVQVELRDGSLLVAESYVVQDRKARIQLAGGTEVIADTRAIRTVRFRKPSPKLDAAWAEIVGGKATGDIIVIRKSAESLDELEGMIHDVTADVVRFELDDDTVPVERGRLEGIVYFQAEGRKLPKPICLLADIHGTVWRLKSLKLDGEQIAATSVVGVDVQLPLAEVQQFDFSSGNLVYLSDLPFASVKWTPYVGSEVLVKSLSKLYEPRRDRSLDGGKLQLPSSSGSGARVEFNKGLAIHSRTEIVFRLEDDFARFKALAGIDDRVRENGHVELVIWGDSRELLRKAIGGTMEPVEIDLDIANVKRLKILVDFGEGQDIADHLDLCDARITK